MIVTKKMFDFTALAVMGNNEIKEVKLSQLMGKNGVILFFYPKDFTFVCPTEIIAFNNKLKEFQDLGYNVVGCSTDNEFSHLAWKKLAVAEGGIGDIQYPLVSDIKKEISREYDVLFDDAVALRASFLIDEKQVVRHAVINDLPLGRSIDEMLRMASALNFNREHGDVCPANWSKGKEGMKANPNGVAEFLKNNAKNL
ncbi:MAG: peroxiredoxin [Ureaplasma sp.]|nr:peroxiredoxin [Ureaplasma sp.]